MLFSCSLKILRKTTHSAHKHTHTITHTHRIKIMNVSDNDEDDDDLLFSTLFDRNYNTFYFKYVSTRSNQAHRTHFPTNIYSVIYSTLEH